MSIPIPVDSERTSETDSYKNEIGEFFDRHWKTYSSQCQFTRLNIETWRQRTIECINQFAEEQIRILDEDITYEKNQWAQKFQDNLETIQSCIEAQSFDLIDDVRHQCRLLEYQVARLENIKREFEFPQVVTVRQQQERGIQRRHESIQQSDPSLSRSSPSKDDELPQFLLPTTVSSTSDLSLGNDSAVVQDSAELKDDATPMCVVCFMLYPPTMSHYDRFHHVEEHFIDNDQINL